MRVRRTSPEPRMEMAPLIDVVFLLLTFFVFAMVLMVRVDTLGVRLPEVTTGESGSPGQSISIVVTADGGVALDGELIELERLVDAVRARVRETPEARLLLAFDQEGRTGDAMRVLNELSRGGFKNLDIIGRPGGAPTGRQGSGAPGGGAQERPEP